MYTYIKERDRPSLSIRKNDIKTMINRVRNDHEERVYIRNRENDHKQLFVKFVCTFVF